MVREDWMHFEMFKTILNVIFGTVDGAAVKSGDTVECKTFKNMYKVESFWKNALLAHQV